jgi:hypothetical protein
MSDDNIMNIQLNNVTGRCDEKCMLKYNYVTSSTCVARNDGTGSINLSYETNSKNPVTFNNNEYNVLAIQIAFPSGNYYNGEPSTGEILILHSSTTANKLLIIGIPISNRSGTPNNLLNDILNNIVSLHISEGNSSDLKLNEEYNLNSILKYKPFYYYDLKSFVDIGVISYGLTDSIYITNDLAESIINLVGSSNGGNMGYSSSLFYNKKGPVKYDEDEIYIDCKPVNSSGKEEIIFKRDNNNNNNNNNNNYNIGIPINTTFIIILFIFIFVILLCVVSYNFYQKIPGFNLPGFNLSGFNLSNSNTKSKYNSKIYSIVDYVLPTKLETVDNIVDYVIKKKNDK